MFGTESYYLHDNLPDSLNFLTFFFGIARACRIENALVRKPFEVPPHTVSV
jgi:hypothetical protein